MKNIESILLRCILNNMIKIECASDELIDSDFSVEILEESAMLLQELNKEDINKIIKEVKKIAALKEYSTHKDFLFSFPENFALVE